MKGFNINCSVQDFVSEILSGMKCIETRNKRTLDTLIGKRVGIIKTGTGKATLTGFCVIGQPIIYSNSKDFDSDYSKHRVSINSSYHINNSKSGVKYGYPLYNIEVISPIEVDSRGIIIRDISSIVKDC